jgi:hypothetical protein
MQGMEKRKRAARWQPFCGRNRYYSLFLEYQVEGDFVPDFHKIFGGKALLYQWLLL